MTSSPTASLAVGGRSRRSFLSRSSLCWSCAIAGRATRSRPTPRSTAEQDWPLFGGTVQRNLVNLVEKNMPDRLERRAGRREERQVVGRRWAPRPTAARSSAGGKIFIGTNNDEPRNPAITGRQGRPDVLPGADGKFLWQAVHDKLAAGRVNDWPEEGICSTPSSRATGSTTSATAARSSAPTPRAWRRQQGVRTRSTWQDVRHHLAADMIELGVFPHNLATCSPLDRRRQLFVITTNGVDEGHINIPVARGAELPRHRQEDRQGAVAGQLAQRQPVKAQGLQAAGGQGPGADARPVVQPGLRRAQRQAADHLPRRRRLDLRLRPDDRRADLEVRLQPQGRRSTSWAATARATTSSPRRSSDENKLYIGVGQDPEHDEGVGHLWCIDITKKPTNKDKDLSPAINPDKDDRPDHLRPEGPRQQGLRPGLALRRPRLPRTTTATTTSAGP